MTFEGYKRKVSAGAGKDYSRVDMGAEAIHRGDQSPSHLASAQADGELVLPDVRIPEREERRLPRQCNSQKKGSLLLTRIRAPAVRPTQWYGVREP